LPVLDAMAQGTPVVVSEGTAPAELAGAAGLTVDPLDTDSITAALRRLLDDSSLAQVLGAEGQARAAGFSWRRTAELVAEAYAEVAP
ncbi:MAG TPA: glycosyltransferase, partial [Acidimicrobiales bacterium]